MNIETGELQMTPSIMYTVLTCRQYYHTRLATLRTTWAKHVNDIYFLGDDMHHGGDSRMLGFDVPLGYDYCGLKFYRYFLWLHSLPKEYDWYLICDDDAYVFRSRVERALCGLNPQERICWGSFLTVWHDAPYLQLRGDFRLPVTYPTGGPGFVMSKALTRAVCRYLADQDRGDPDMRTTPFSRFGDASIGFWMQKIGFRMIHDGRWNHFNPQTMKHTPAHYRATLAYHYVPAAGYYELMRYDGGGQMPRIRRSVRGIH